MIDYIQGNITQKSPAHVVIESGGLGYFVNISLNTYSHIEEKSFCKLHTYLHFSGGLQGSLGVSLFGFYDEMERKIFIELLGISGVGATTVRMILSSLSPDEIQKAIASENVKLLESIKGIGAKTAKRIVLEMKDKIMKYTPASKLSVTSGNNVKEEALTALQMLGFQRVQSEQALQKIFDDKKDWTVEELIKQALKSI